MGVPIEFCERFLNKAKKTIPLFDGVMSSKAKGTWIPANRKPYGVVINEHTSHGEMCFQGKNRAVEFNQLFQKKQSIENAFGKKIEWKSPDSKNIEGKFIKRAQLKTPTIFFGYADRESWNTLIDQLVEMMSKFINAVEEVGMQTSQRSATAVHPPNKAANEFLPDKAFTERAIAQLRQMQHESPSSDEILDQIEKMALFEKKTLKKNWREITKRIIIIWFSNPRKV